VVPETDEVNQVDAVGSRWCEDAANAVAVVSLAVCDGDDEFWVVAGSRSEA